MENEQLAIETAYQEVVTHLTQMRDRYLEEMRTEPESYKGIDSGDVYTWFIESF